MDLVVADPPRAGLDSPVVEALLRRPPREIRYVSCDPAALGRDAGRLVRGGLELRQLTLLDMFAVILTTMMSATSVPPIAVLPIQAKKSPILASVSPPYPNHVA